MRSERKEGNLPQVMRDKDTEDARRDDEQTVAEKILSATERTLQYSTSHLSH